MKNWKLSELMPAPLAIIIVVSAVAFAVEYLFMALLHEVLVPALPFKLSDNAWDVIDAATLTAILSPMLYFLVFRKMQEDKERFKKINAAAINAIVIVNEQGRITSWNLAAQKMFGYSEEEAVGQPLHQLIAPPHYRDDAVRGFAHFEESGDGPLIGKIIEVVALRKDGSEFPVELSISAIKLKNCWHAVGIMHDITGRKLAQRALLEERDFAVSILSTAQAIILLLDKEGRVVSFNPYMENISGWRIDEVRDKDWFSTFIPERNRDATRKLFQAAIGNTKTLGKVDTLLTRDGRELQIEWCDKTLRDGSDGKVKGLLAVGQDVTMRKQREDEMQELLDAANQSRQVMLGVIEDQRRAEEMLRHLNEELENKVLARTADLEHARRDADAANQAKSAFLAAMSHEIRTPMNGVIGMADMLHQSSLHGYQVEMVDLIRESAYSLLGIINDILDFSKIEAGKLEIEQVPTRVAEVVEDVCGMLDSMAEKKEVELTLFTDPAIPTEVLGDKLRLRQVLINLVNNAIKFSSKQQAGRVSLRAVLVESTPEQILLEFRVTDNGIGMDAETLHGLFTPFSQADISTTRRFGGTGLGLSIAHHLVELMGGEITVQSEPGKGSTFTVHLLFALPDVGRPASTGSGQDSSRHDGDGVGLKPDLQVAGLSCLVVGDTESLADDLSAYLAHDGAVVERAPNLAVAGERADTLPPVSSPFRDLEVAPTIGGTVSVGAASRPRFSSPRCIWVWVIDAAGEPPSPDELRAVARAYPEQEIHFVVIGCGPRRKPRVGDAGLVSVDGNVLTRGVLLKAVAIAAGRVQIEKETPLPGKSEAEFRPPSRDDALRQGRLILVAEDNETNQKVILRQLALLGFAADIADNGRIALERWQSDGYALLLCDLHMPEMDGYELTAAIRAAEQGTARHIPILALTANAIKGEADHCRAIGMDDYLSKPVQLADLKAMLEKWIPVVENRGLETAPTKTASPIVGATSRSRKGDENRGDENRDDENRGLEIAPTEGAPTTYLHVDVNVLKTLVGDDAALIRDFLHTFRVSAAKIAAELRAEMEKAGKAGDAETLATLLPKFEQELAGVEGFLDEY